jgi:protein tyrosine phosphatase (PTP) superfamily phosphohydrolase (DUF442 family)
MKIKHFIILMVASALIGVLQLYAVDNSDSVDSVSGATKEWKMPPSGYDYTVSYVVGIEGYVIVYNKNLYRGGKITPKGASRLKDFGVKTVVSIAPDKAVEDACKAAGLKLVTLPFDRKVMTKEILNRFLEILKENKGGYYLHSKEERQRAGVFAVIYRLHIDKWTFDKAIIEYARIGGNLKDHDRMLKGIIL